MAQFNRSRASRGWRSTPVGEHRPVLSQELMELLNPQKGEIVVDCTLGHGGHAKKLLESVGPIGRLVGLDWDADNLPHARDALAATGLPFTVHHTNFAAVATVLANEGVEGVHILIADLGMSSMQVDDPDRGFSYVREGPLDMRMDRSRGLTAAEILAAISESDLAAALRDLGDEPAADVIAAAIVRSQRARPICRTNDLARIIGAAANQPIDRQSGWRLHPQRGRWTIHPAARTFQALRILVNRELANLRHLLRVLPQILHTGGRAAIISFHSGEDRLVKAAFRMGGEAGHYCRIAPDPIRASETEKLDNPRSRSAKLRYAIRC